MLLIVSVFVCTEEAEMTEDGEEVVGFGLRKLLKTATTSDQTTPLKPRKQFSLDFPPGLVHDESECEQSQNRWKEIKNILEKNPKKHEKAKKKKRLL